MKQSFVKYILGILCFVFLLVPSSVFAGNTAPIARDDNATTNKNTVVVIDVMANDEDPDGGNISLTKITVQASHGTAEIKDGKVEYTPENGYTGSDSFEYEIKDDDGGWFDSDKTDTATVTITINDVPNIAPNAVDDSADTKENKAVTINVLANDTDDNGDTLSVTSTSNGPSHGSVTINDDNTTITYTPDSGYYGSDSFDYTISDGNGGEDTATVTVNVSHVIYKSSAPVCIESLSYGRKEGVGSGCFNADGIFQGGTGCLQKLKLRNLSDENITASNLVVDYSDFSGTLDNTCGIDGVDETGHDCSVSSSPKDAIYDPYRAFSQYKTHSLYLGVTNANNGSSPFDGNISIEYVIDGQWYNAPVEKCQIESTTSQDLCYDKIDQDGMCDLFGIVSFSCTTTYNLRNVSDDVLYAPSVDLISTSLFTGHILDDCGIDEKSGNCSDSDVMDMGFMGMSGMGMASTIYFDPMPDFDSNDTHRPYAYTTLKFDIFGQTTPYGTYVKDGKLYHGEIKACNPDSGSYISGPFDAWDTFRDDDVVPPSDRNISTKIIEKPFKLSIASLNKLNTAYETKNGLGSSIEVAIYAEGNNSAISNTITFDANTTDHISESDELTVTQAVKIAHVGFRFCATYDTNLYILYPSDKCSGVNQDCNATTTPENPTWHICYATDTLAIRPKLFDIKREQPFASNEDIDLLRSGKDYNLTMYALDENNISAIGYNQSSSKLDINVTILDQSGNENDSLSGTVGFASNDFHFEDGNSTDDNGNREVVGLSFDDVGRVKINIFDKDWASVDADDTPQSCEGGTFNGLEVPYGTFICGDLDATFIPDHFELKDINITNRRKNENFTYISSDLNMSAHVELRIEAVNANGDITKNFRDGDTVYYENPVELNITVPLKDINGSDIKDIYDENLTTVEHNITKALLGFGGNDENGTHTIVWNETNSSQQIMFNYNRKANVAVNPFEINGSDVNISVVSLYKSSNGKEAKIEGWSVIDNQKAEFVYARVKATKDFYDDVKTDSIKTPIKVEVYCDRWPATSSNCPGVDTVLGATNNYKWFISTSHDMASNDGNINLSIDEYGSFDKISTIRETTSIINKEDKGIDNYITVTNTANSLPSITHISLDIRTGKTNSWLVYDPNNIIVPGVTNSIPLYKVRFIGTASWSGIGKTGNVVGTDASTKKSNRLDW